MPYDRPCNHSHTISGNKMRTFATGATRAEDAYKLDFEGFLSPLAMHAFAEYMQGHQIQADGARRESDNWQKGIPKSAYIKSAWRHFFQLWADYRKDESPESLKESCCAIMFNIQGFLHELCQQAAAGEAGPDNSGEAVSP